MDLNKLQEQGRSRIKEMDVYAHMFADHAEDFPTYVAGKINNAPTREAAHDALLYALTVLHGCQMGAVGVQLFVALVGEHTPPSAPAMYAFSHALDINARAELLADVILS